MQKTILITGSTDGIGLEAAKMLVSKGHHVLLHGRNPSKLEKTKRTLSAIPGRGKIETYVADLSKRADIEALAESVKVNHEKLDVLINNAGVLDSPDPTTPDGLDMRFAVNTVAPYLLTKRLLPLFGPSGRIINVSSASQASVQLEALAGKKKLSRNTAYGESKLALIMWSNHLAHSLKESGPVVISVNPGSLLGTKMVKEGFGIQGKDIRIGGTILTRLALEEEFVEATGMYYDNDKRRIGSPHPDALDAEKCKELTNTLDHLWNSRSPWRSREPRPSLA